MDRTYREKERRYLSGEIPEAEWFKFKRTHNRRMGHRPTIAASGIIPSYWRDEAMLLLDSGILSVSGFLPMLMRREGLG